MSDLCQETWLGIMALVGTLTPVDIDWHEVGKAAESAGIEVDWEEIKRRGISKSLVRREIDGID